MARLGRIPTAASILGIFEGDLARVYAVHTLFMLRTNYCKIAREVLDTLTSVVDSKWDADRRLFIPLSLTCSVVAPASFLQRKPTDRFRRLLDTDRICRWPSGVELYQRPMTCVVFGMKSYDPSNSIQRRSSCLGDSLEV